MIGLETERLVFRQWQNSDYKQFSEFYAQEEHAKYVGGQKSPEESWRLMATYIGHYTLKGYSYLAITEKSTEKLIGTVGLWKSEPWPEKELGYWLLPEAQGKGYGVEAGLAVRDYGLDTLKFDSLVSYIDPSNQPSVQLATRLGAKYDQTIELLDFGPHAIYRYK
ncbi:GNAT family N-acetyltransferase [Roseivirga sp. E12]|uniref:GNAT family N-acetyltransferase n=1 Tax=Roseivirga sp. E12 TaxID=2819237 RepID=UPI001ABC3D27|nr:GNAT family N-acetyltransferase [Roseivirga sp. E12]MBO3697685.1 GNAT family N-acetyltransferase [Roseivirga sp. E12]